MKCPQCGKDHQARHAERQIENVKRAQTRAGKSRAF